MNRNANTIFGVVAAAALILSGCINNVDTETGGNSTVPDGKCSLTVDSGLSVRAAFPSSLAGDMVYAAEISYSSSGAEKWLGADSVENSPAVLKNSPSASGEIRFVFCAPEESAEYTITVFACPSGTSVASAADVENAAAASGRAEFSLEAGQKALETPVKVSLSPTSNVSGTGSVNLPLSFDSSLGIAAAKVNVTKDGVSDSSGNSYGFEIEVSGNSARLFAENAPAGTYLAIMKFYKSATDFSSVNEVAVNSAVQQVSVYSGMTTDCWFVDGKKLGAAGADGTFTPSALELAKYDFTELYVCGTDGGGEYGGKRSFYVSSNFGSSVPAASDTDGDGSMAKPFATVQKAVDKIAAAGDTSKKYTVYVDGTITAEASISIDSNISVKSAYSSSEHNNNALIKWSDSAASGGFEITSSSFVMDGITLDGNGKAGTGIFFGGSSMELNNCVIRKFNQGGLTVEGKITLENCSVLDNKADDKGGGIYMSGGTLTLKNTVVNKNSAKIGGGISFSGKELVLENTSVTYNESSSNGGGIDADGKVTISDSEILSNSATNNGGGIYFGNGEKIISDTTINENSAEYGGGIFMLDGTLNLESGAIIGEKLDPDYEANDISKVAKEDDCGNWSTKQLSSSGNYAEGAGIHVAAGTVNMKDGAYICRNYTECTGGGVVIKSGGTFNMTGGTVGWNYSNYGGGIRCDGKLNISGNSIICYNKVSTQYVQGFCGRGAGILVNGESSAEAVISGSTKIFGNLAVRGENASTNIDALGAGIYCSGTLTVEGGEIHDNSTESDGAAIGIESGVVTLSNCKIWSNTAGRDGGAIFISTVNKTTDATLTIKENVSIESNRTDGSGGAIYATTNQHKDYAQGKNSYVYIGEDKNTGGIVITGNYANRGGAFYGADNARFVMNAGKVSENYSTGSTSGDGGGAMFLWGSGSSYSTFTMNGGEISGNRAKSGGAGGAVHIDDGSGKNASFIMTGGLLEDNYACNAYNDPAGSNLGGAIYLKNGGQIKLGGSAVIAVSEESDSCNDIYLGNNQTITITGTLAPENNDAAGNPKYTARITPESYTVGISLITADSGVTLEDEVGKFCVTENADSDEWFITTEGKLSKPTAVSSLSSTPDFSIYPKLTVSTASEMNKLSGFVNNGNTMAGTTVTLLNDITLDSDFQNIGNTDKPFSGTFDGNGKKIDSGTASLWAIFYQVTGGTIKNLTSSGKFSMSGIVANLSDKGLIENCTNTATVTSDTYSPLGGVCAKMENSIIDRCVNKGSVKLEKSGKSLSLALGGICGSATGVIKNSTNYDSVVYTETSSNDSCFVGGILGTTTVSADVDTELYNCINIGDVSGNEESASGIGGILGDAYILNCSVSMKNCVNMGNSSKNAIAGKCVGTSKDKTTIDFTYYLEDSAPSVFAWNHDNAKAYSFKKCADLYMTTDRVTVGTFLSDDLIELLNAWVDKKNSSGAEQYLNWDTVDDRPSLVYE